jgi:hypothetical protein
MRFPPLPSSLSGGGLPAIIVGGLRFPVRPAPDAERGFDFRDFNDFISREGCHSPRPSSWPRWATMRFRSPPPGRTSAFVFHDLGYRLAMAYTGDGPLAEHGGRALRPALAAIEGGQCPALVMDELADGRLVVFVPASPAPMSGAVYVFAPDKVTYLNVPLLPFLKVISSWGLGLSEIIETQADQERSALATPVVPVPDGGG